MDACGETLDRDFVAQKAQVEVNDALMHLRYLATKHVRKRGESAGAFMRRKRTFLAALEAQEARVGRVVEDIAGLISTQMKAPADSLLQQMLPYMKRGRVDTNKLEVDDALLQLRKLVLAAYPPHDEKPKTTQARRARKQRDAVWRQLATHERRIHLAWRAHHDACAEENTRLHAAFAKMISTFAVLDTVREFVEPWGAFKKILDGFTSRLSPPDV